MLLLILMPIGLMRLAGTELIVTNRRVLGRIRNQRMSIRFEDIDSVVVQRGPLGLIFNYGAVIVKGSGTQMRYAGLIAPKKLKTRIDEEVENALFGELLSKEKDTQKKPQPERKVAPPPPAATPPAAKEVHAPKTAEKDDEPARKSIDPNTW